MSTLEASTLSPLIPNPLPGHSMSVRDMYDLVNKQDASWGISGYKVPQEYLDSREMRAIREGNPKKAAPKPTKKGDYLSETIKATKNLPAPNHYNVVKPWADEKNKGKAPPKVGNRTTFLDEIALEGKRRPQPGPGAYDVLKASKTKESLAKKGSERDNFLFDVEYVSNTIPGPGNYNPREIQPKIKEAKLKPEDWIKKHKQDSAVKKSNFPEVGTYTPSPAGFDTFDKLAEKQKSGKGAAKKNWGTEVRFGFEKKGKKVDTAPGPGQYNMIASWSGSPAKGGKDDKKEGTTVFNHITKGISKSIYYS